MDKYKNFHDYVTNNKDVNDISWIFLKLVVCAISFWLLIIFINGDLKF